MIIRLAVASLMVASAAGAFFGDAAPRRAPGVSRAAVAAHSVRGGAAPRCEAASAAAEEEIPPLASHPRRRVALLVEPTPFTHVSGYSNRFREMLRFLKEGGDVAEVTTADDTPARPDDFMGMPIRYVPGFRLPLYKQVQLTVDFGFGGLRMLQSFQPTIIHAAAPGVFCIVAILYSRILGVPLVFSYHTDLQVYADRYVPWPVLNQLARGLTAVVLPTVLNWADLCLCTSPQLKEQLEGIGVRNLDVWRKGIDTDVFNPKFNEDNGEMRAMLSGGEPSRPLLLYVGRLGTEKNVGLVREVLRRIPDARLAVVGAGPAEEELRETFAGTDTIFTGLLQGEKLSRAYAAADVFVMPSESETLGFVVLESFASGVPVVAADAGGVPNIVGRDDSRGLLFKPGDVDDLTAKVKMLLDDPALRKRMGDAGRAETVKWDWKAATSVLRNVQYTKAEERFNEHRGGGKLEMPDVMGWVKGLLPSDDAGTSNFGGNTTLA